MLGIMICQIKSFAFPWDIQHITYACWKDSIENVWKTWKAIGGIFCHIQFQEIRFHQYQHDASFWYNLLPKPTHFGTGNVVLFRLNHKYTT